MRVAAGLTIFGHAVRLVFMTEPVAETEANAELAELLELSDITPETTVPAMAGELTLLDAEGAGRCHRRQRPGHQSVIETEEKG